MDKDEAIEKLKDALKIVTQVQEVYPRLRELNDADISICESIKEIKVSADDYYK